VVFTRETYSEAKGRSIAHLWRAAIDGSGQTEIDLPEGCDEIHTFDLSPSGNHIAFMCPNADSMAASLYVFSTTDQTSVPLSNSVAFGTPHWSPDGGRLAYGSVGDLIHFVDADGSDKQDWAETPGGGLTGWTPDGRIIFDGAFGPCEPEGPAFCHPQSIIVDLVTGEPTYLPYVISLGEWSPDGRYVLAWVDPRSPERPATYPSPYAATEMIDITTGDRRRLSIGDSNVSPSLWLRDGQSFLVSIHKPAEVYTPIDCSVWRVPVSDFNARTEVMRGDCGPSYFSRNGREIYSVRVPQLGIPDQRADLYRIDSNSGKATLLIEEVANVAFYEPAP
jgi:hypothetical protein